MTAPTTPTLPGTGWPYRAVEIPDYDPIVARYEQHPLSFLQDDAMAELWAMGEDGWLREDCRFRPTPWGRWTLANRWLINDGVYETLTNDLAGRLALADQLAAHATMHGLPAVFCPGDPRLVLEDGQIRLASIELSDQPLLEQVPEDQQYVTHLPVLSLMVAAASLPAGEWGASQEPQEIRPLGWLRVHGLGRSLRRNMFVARVRGESMNGGKNPLESGSWAAFEFTFHQGVTYEPGATQPVVLVRGSFEDPETGTFAVKRLFRMQGETRLVSANSDKTQYPDIVITESDLSDVWVIATLTKGLRSSDFDRRPRMGNRMASPRPLDTAAGLAHVARSLAEQVESFFLPSAVPNSQRGAHAPSETARLVCLDAKSGGLHVGLGPLPNLPTFIKRCRVIGGTHQPLLLASLVRSGHARVAVVPGEGPWRLLADGFEEETQDLGLAPLVCAVAPLEEATVFRVDAADVGQRVTGGELAVGHHYRVLLPPALAVRLALPTPPQGFDIERMAGGWCICDFELAPERKQEFATLLAAIGLSVSGTAPRLEWVLASPLQWRTSPRGVLFPCFAVGSPIAVAVSGWQADTTAQVFVAGTPVPTPVRTAVSSGDLVQLPELPVGNYVCSLWHPDRQFDIASTCFSVVAMTVQPLMKALQFHLQEPGSGKGKRLLAGDSADVPLDASTPSSILSVSLAAGWPLRVTWRSKTLELLGTVVADEAGDYDLEALWPKVASRAARHRVGDLEFDFGDFGVVALRHDRESAPLTTQSTLARLIGQFSPSLLAPSSLRPHEDPATWLPLWFEPIAGELGYSCADAPQAIRDALSSLGIVAKVLFLDERGPEGFRCTATRLLIVGEDVELEEPQKALAVQQAMFSADLVESLVTDGLRWTLRKRSDRKARQVFDIAQVAEDFEKLEHFLVDLGAGV